MSRGGAPYTNIQADHSRIGEEDKSYMSLDEPLGNKGSLGQALLFDVEDPTADNLSEQVVGEHAAYHDRRWAYAFKVNVIMTIVGAICFGTKAFEAISSDQKLGGLGERRLSGESDTYAWVPVFFGGLGLVALGGGIAFGILLSLINCGKPIIWTLMGLITLSWLSLIVRLAASGSIFGAALVGLFFYFLVRFFHRRMARFHFGATNLKVSVTKVSRHQNRAARLLREFERSQGLLNASRDQCTVSGTPFRFRTSIQFLRGTPVPQWWRQRSHLPAVALPSWNEKGIVLMK